jgi:large subunit ribosomal protein L6
MSRIGKQPIEVPSGVEVVSADDVVTVKGPRGELAQRVHPELRILQEDGVVRVERGRDLELSVGYSHPVHVSCPDGIEFEVPTPTSIVIRGNDKQAVGEIAAKIRKVRKPEPYKGKGIRYEGEFVRKKAGKAAKGGA